MRESSKLIPTLYAQPITESYERKLSGLMENVSYNQDSHFRIWCNTQTEGYDLHYHNAIEIIIPIENVYTVIVSEKQFVLNAGDILLIPCRAPHEICPPEQGYRFIYLINLDLLSGFHDAQALEPVLMTPLVISKHLYPDIYDIIYSKFVEINKVYFSNDILWEFSSYALFMNILIILGQNQYRMLSSNNIYHYVKQQVYYEKFTNLLLYIDSHYASNLTLEQVASYVGFSKYHFSRLFKIHTNTTFHEYLNRKRIQVAQSLLSTNLSVTDIAFQTGFNNTTSFNRCFKKYTNCSPNQYRSLFKQQNLPNIPQS